MRLALAAALAALPLAAPAATFDLAALADAVKAERGGSEATWSEAMPDGWTVDGLTLDVDGPGWLDGGFVSRAGWETVAAGLGSCNAPSGRCDKSDFDGIREPGERIVLMFDRVVSAAWTIRETLPDFLRGGPGGTVPDHTLSDGCARVNGVDRAVTGGALVTGERSATWVFEPCAEGRSDYYVAAVEATPAPVPLPAGVWLLGAALAGLGAVRVGRAGR